MNQLNKKKEGLLLTTLLERTPLNRDNVLLTLQAPTVATGATPGQFVNVAAGQFLRRPFGLAAVDPVAGTIELGVRVVGEGSAWLAGREPGSELELLGPLGRGFTLGEQDEWLLVGGGSGLYPLLFLQTWLADQGRRSTVVLGFRQPSDLVLATRFGERADRLILASESGGLDVQGTVIDALQGFEPAPGTNVAICGPTAMMAAVARWSAERDLPAECSLETRMGCGFGVCRCCPVPVTGERDPLRCCVEGPVFPASEIEWEELLA